MTSTAIGITPSCRHGAEHKLDTLFLRDSLDHGRHFLHRNSNRPRTGKRMVVRDQLGTEPIALPRSEAQGVPLEERLDALQRLEDLQQRLAEENTSQDAGRCWLAPPRP